MTMFRMRKRFSALRKRALSLGLTVVWIGAACLWAWGSLLFASEGPPGEAVDVPPDVIPPRPLHELPPAVEEPSHSLRVMAEAAAEFPTSLNPDDFQAPSVLLMELQTGEVLFEKAGDVSRPPASITKVMTMLLTYEAVERGEADWEDPVTISSAAEGMGGTQAFLAAGQVFPLRDLLKAVAVASANDAAVAIAEHLAGSENAFVERMNARAAELGMRNTHFENPHGLDAENHRMSAHDVAIVSRELLRNYPEVLELTQVWTYTFDVGGGCCLLTNTNRMIRHYQGVDGLKTGWTQRAGFGVSATGERNGTRYIAVVLGHEHPQERFREAAELLAWGFAHFEAVPIVKAGEILKELTVYEGRETRISAVAETDFSVLVRKGTKQQLRQQTRFFEPVIAPVEAGDLLGTLRVLHEESELGRIDLVADRTVPSLGWTGLWWRILRSLQTGVPIP